MNKSSYQLSVVSDQLSVIGYRLSAICHLPSAICSLFILSLFIGSCVPNGLSSVAKSGGRVAVVSDRDVYVVSAASPEIVYHYFRPDIRYAPAISPDGKSIVFVDQQRRLIRQSFDGGEPKVLVPLVGFPGPGAFLFLPNGDLFFMDTRTEGIDPERYVNVFNVNTGEQPVPAVLGIQQVFISVNAVKPKYSAVTTGAYTSAAKLDASQPGQFRIVFQAKNYFYLYSGEEKGFVYNQTLPRVLDYNDQVLLSRRVQDDVTSGLLTADAKWLIVRVRSGAVLGTTTSLYAINLMFNEPIQPVILDVPVTRRINYALSPSGHFVAYEEVINGVTHVQLHNLDTNQKTSLGIGTLDPKWWK